MSTHREEIAKPPGRAGVIERGRSAHVARRVVEHVALAPLAAGGAQPAVRLGAVERRDVGEREREAARVHAHRRRADDAEEGELVELVPAVAEVLQDAGGEGGGHTHLEEGAEAAPGAVCMGGG